MYKIKNRISELSARKEIIKYKKIKKIDEGNSVVKSKIEKQYDYYKCDYCGEEIRLDKKPYERNGGIVDIPENITKGKRIVLALHNKCLNKTLKELERGDT